MAIFPSALSNLTNPAGTDSMADPSKLHSAQHSNANDEIDAIEAELGINPRGAYATVGARLTGIENSINAAVPPGAIFGWPGAAAPTGFFFLAGQVLVRATYPNLFALFGTTFNTGGELATEFRLPDARGRTIVGLDNMGGTDAGRLSAANTLGGTGGSEGVVLTTNELPAHTHGINHGHADTIGIAGTGSITTGNQNTDHAHTVPDHNHGAYTFGGNGAHSHNVLATVRSIYAGGGGNAGMYALSYSTPTDTQGGHEHNVGTNGSGAIGTTGVSANHGHDYSHGHSKTGSVTDFAGSSASAGSGNAFSIMQPYILLNWIVKYG